MTCKAELQALKDTIRRYLDAQEALEGMKGASRVGYNTEAHQIVHRRKRDAELANLRRLVETEEGS